MALLDHPRAEANPARKHGIGPDIDHGGGPTWLTGSYDPESNTVYWPTGNAGPDFNGDNRIGDNLYSCSILALDARHRQAQVVLPSTRRTTNGTGMGNSRRCWWTHSGRAGRASCCCKRIVTASSTCSTVSTAKLLLAKPLVKKLTWAKGIAPDGRPVMNPNQVPTREGTLICPAVEGATNLFSTSYNPQTGLFYVNTLEKCATYTKRPAAEWQAGRAYTAGGGRQTPDAKAAKNSARHRHQDGQVRLGASAGPVLAIPGAARSPPPAAWSSSATIAARWPPRTHPPASASGTTLSPKSLHTSPMTYMFDNKQYVAIAAGGNLFSFALVE